MDVEIPINANGNFIIKTVLTSGFFILKVIYIDDACGWVYDPVFPNAGCAIFKEFDAVIHLLG